MTAYYLISEPLDDLTTRQVHLAARATTLGPVRIALWTDEQVTRSTGRPPTFPLAERRYWWESCRFVDRVVEVSDPTRPDASQDKPAGWVMESTHPNRRDREAWCRANGVDVVLIDPGSLTTFPAPPACPIEPKSESRRVVVTGCFDWFHTGHVRFFEEVAGLGDLYVCVGHDQNIRLLKGADRPLFPQDERAFIAGSVRFVKQAIITSGEGWMDAAPEIDRLKPHIYAVNEDGDKPDKRAFCERHGIAYVVLKRLPKQGLTARSSTALRESRPGDS
jgi:cytidyltransferase-like protein